MLKMASEYSNTSVIKTMAMVVMLVTAMGLGEVRANTTQEPDLRRLWDRVTSHTESLRHVNWYLKQTDIFWVWFQENKERLDDILAGRRAPSPDNDRLLERLHDLELKQKTQDEQLEKMRTDLQEEKEKTRRMDALLHQQEEERTTGRQSMERTTDDLMMFVRNKMKVVTKYFRELRDEKIPTLEEGMARLETQMAALNKTVSRNKRDVDERVMVDLTQIQQKIESLKREVNESRLTSRDEKDAMTGLLEDVLVNTIFPLESQVAQLNESRLYFSDHVNQKFAQLNRDIASLSSRESPKQNKNRRFQSQITNLQANVSKLQGDIGRLDGRVSGLQSSGSWRDQLRAALEDHSKLRESMNAVSTQIANLDKSSDITNHKLYEITTDVQHLKTSVDNLEQYNNSSDTLRRSRRPGVVPIAASINVPPPGPPGIVFGRPGNGGFRGEPGDSGPPGAPGNPGSRGGQGSPGAPGGQGTPGSPGLRGTPGNRGVSGNPGFRGAPGAPGIPGIRGGPGAPGNIGLRGAPGNPGIRGGSGAPGDLGLRGAPGNPGVRGASGSPGVTGGQGSSGAPGRPGEPGSSGVRGSLGAPVNVELQGPPGSPGRTGMRGSQGNRGSPGQPGVPGRRGEPGSPGRPGYAGGNGSRAGYPSFPEYTDYRTTRNYPGYSATSGYARGHYYQG